MVLARAKMPSATASKHFLISAGLAWLASLSCLALIRVFCTLCYYLPGLLARNQEQLSINLGILKFNITALLSAAVKSS